MLGYFTCMVKVIKDAPLAGYKTSMELIIIIIYLTAIGFLPGGSSTTIGHNRQVIHT
jgi:hypothetical protein